MTSTWKDMFRWPKLGLIRGGRPIRQPKRRFVGRGRRGRRKRQRSAGLRINFILMSGHLLIGVRNRVQGPKWMEIKISGDWVKTT